MNIKGVLPPNAFEVVNQVWILCVIVQVNSRILLQMTIAVVYELLNGFFILRSVFKTPLVKCNGLQLTALLYKLFQNMSFNFVFNSYKILYLIWWESFNQFIPVIYENFSFSISCCLLSSDKLLKQNNPCVKIQYFFNSIRNV